MRLIFAILFFLYACVANAQVTGAVFSGARYNHSSDIPVIPYQQEVLDYQDSLWANGITDTVTGIDALNWLVWTLKGNNTSYPFNFWDSILACYPFHGGTAYSHAINIKDVAGVKINWIGSPTHSANGVTGNGTSAWGNTGINAPIPNERPSGMLICAWKPTSTISDIAMGTSNQPNDWVLLTNTVGTINLVTTAALGTIWASPVPSNKHKTMFGQKDNRFDDSLRRWGSNGEYYSFLIPGNRPTGNGQGRVYGVLGRSTNLAGTAAAPYTTSTSMGHIFLNGALDNTRGAWLVEIWDEYIFKLRGLTP